MSTPSDRPRSQANQPTFFEVASDQPPEPKPAPPAWGRPRLRTANREQIVFRAAPLDAIIPQDHPARIVWAYVEGLLQGRRSGHTQANGAIPGSSADADGVNCASARDRADRSAAN